MSPGADAAVGSRVLPILDFDGVLGRGKTKVTELEGAPKDGTA